MVVLDSELRLEMQCDVGNRLSDQISRDTREHIALCEWQSEGKKNGKLGRRDESKSISMIWQDNTMLAQNRAKTFLYLSTQY